MGFWSQTLTHVQRLWLIQSRQLLGQGRYKSLIWIEEVFHLLLFCCAVLVFSIFDYNNTLAQQKRQQDNNSPKENGDQIALWYFPNNLQVPSGMENNLRDPEQIVRKPGKGIKYPYESEVKVIEAAKLNVSVPHFIVKLCDDSANSVVFRKALYVDYNKDISNELFSYLMTAYKTTGVHVKYSQGECTNGLLLHKGWFWLILYLGWKSGLIFFLFVYHEKIVNVHDALILLGGSGPAYIISWYLQIIVHNLLLTCLYGIFYYSISMELAQIPAAHRFMTAYFVLTSFVSGAIITVYIIVPKASVVVFLVTLYHGLLLRISLMPCETLHGLIDFVLPHVVLACMAYYPDVYIEDGVIESFDFWKRLIPPFIGYFIFIIFGLTAASLQVSFWLRWIKSYKKDDDRYVALYKEIEYYVENAIIKLSAKDKHGSIFPKDFTMFIHEKATTAILDSTKTKRTSVLKSLMGRQGFSNEVALMDKEIRSNMCMCPDTDFLFETLTVEETLEIYHKIVGHRNKQQFLSIADDFYMSEKLAVKVEDLSNDNKKLLMLAVAFLRTAEIYLLDEPTKGLKGHSLHMAVNSISRKKRNATIIMTTSEGQDAERLADFIAIVVSDKIRLYGSLNYIHQTLGIGTHIQLDVSSRKSLRSLCVYMWLFAPMMVCVKKFSLEHTLSPLCINFFIRGFGQHVVEYIISNLRQRVVEFNITDLRVSDIGIDRVLQGFLEPSLFESLVTTYLDSVFIGDCLDMPILQQIKHWLAQADQVTRHIRHSSCVDGFQHLLASVSSGSFTADNGGLFDSAMSLTDFLKVVSMRYTIQHQSNPSQRTASVASYISGADYNQTYTISKNLQAKDGLGIQRSESKLNIANNNNNNKDGSNYDGKEEYNFNHGDNNKNDEKNQIHCCFCTMPLNHLWKSLIPSQNNKLMIDITDRVNQSMEVYDQIRCNDDHHKIDFERNKLIQNDCVDGFNENMGFNLQNVNLNLCYYDHERRQNLNNSDHFIVRKQNQHNSSEGFCIEASSDGNKNDTNNYSNDNDHKGRDNSSTNNINNHNDNGNSIGLDASNININNPQQKSNVTCQFDQIILEKHCDRNDQVKQQIVGAVRERLSSDLRLGPYNNKKEVLMNYCGNNIEIASIKEGNVNQINCVNSIKKDFYCVLTYDNEKEGHASSWIEEDCMDPQQENLSFEERIANNCNNNNPNKADNLDTTSGKGSGSDKKEYDLRIYRMMVWGLDSQTDLPFPFPNNNIEKPRKKTVRRIKTFPFPFLRHALRVSVYHKTGWIFLILLVMSIICLLQAMQINDVLDNMQTNKIHKIIGNYLNIQPYLTFDSPDEMSKSWISKYKNTLHDLWAAKSLKSHVDVCEDHITFLGADVPSKPSFKKSPINLTIYYSENSHYLSLVTAMEALQRYEKNIDFSVMDIKDMYFNPVPLIDKCNYLDANIEEILNVLSVVFSVSSWCLILCMTNLLQDTTTKKFHDLLVLSGASGTCLYLIRTLINTAVHVCIITASFIGFTLFQDREYFLDSVHSILYFMLVQTTFGLCTFGFVNCLVLGPFNKMALIVWAVYEGVNVVISSVLYKEMKYFLSIMSPTTGLIQANGQIVHEIMIIFIKIYKPSPQVESLDCDSKHHGWLQDCSRYDFQLIATICIAHVGFFFIFLISFKVLDFFTWNSEGLDNTGPKDKAKNTCRISAFDLDIKSSECLALFRHHQAYHGLADRAQTLISPKGLKTGTVSFEGTILAKSKGSQSIGYCPMANVFEPCLTGRGTLELFGSLRGKAMHKLTAEIDELLEALTLDEVANLQLINYSDHDLRKLQVAISLIGEPKFLLLDHPTNGLNLPDQMRVWNRIKTYRERGHAVILTSNCAEECYMLGTTIVVLVNHFIKLCCTSQELKEMSEGYFAFVWLRRDTRGRAVPVVKVAREVQRRFHHGVFALVDKVHDPYIIFSFVSANITIDLDHSKIYDTMEDMQEAGLIRHYEIRQASPQLSLEAYVHEWMPY